MNFRQKNLFDRGRRWVVAVSFLLATLVGARIDSFGQENPPENIPASVEGASVEGTNVEAANVELTNETAAEPLGETSAETLNEPPAEPPAEPQSVPEAAVTPSPTIAPHRAMAGESAAASLSSLPPAEPVSAGSSRQKRIRIEKGLTFWLTDGDGNWKIPLPNWSLEDIMRGMESKERPRDDLPYVIESVSVRGEAQNDSIELTTEYRIMTGPEAVVRVPLGLNEGVWIPPTEGAETAEPLQYSGPGSCYLDIDRAGGGYVAVIGNRAPESSIPEKAAAAPRETAESPAEGSAAVEQAEESAAAAQEDLPPKAPIDGSARIRHTVTLRLVFRIESVGSEEHQLKATFAPAITSKVRLIIPIPDLHLTVSEGVLALHPVNLNETTSEITLNGLSRTGAATELIWRKRESRAPDVQKALQVEDAVITVALDAQGAQYDVTFPLRCFGDGFDLFRIRLPQGVHLVRDSVLANGVNNAPIGIREVKETLELPAESTSADKTAADVSVAEIRLSREITDSVTIQFKAMSQNPLETAETSGDRPAWDLGGFDVLGAQKQYGRLKVQMPKETTFNLTCVRAIRAAADPQGDDGNDTEYFSFFSQPFSLRAQVIVRQPRVSVSPEYQILVQHGRVRLNARFQYAVHGGLVRQLRLKTADWFTGEVRPDNVVDIEKIYTDQQTGELVLPLVVPSEGTIQIDLTAVRELSHHQELLELPIPVPVADWVEPAAVVIVPDDDVELIPVAEKFCDLLPKGPRTVPLSLEIPPRQQSPLMYQAKQNLSGGNAPYPLFVSEVLFHEQKVEVASETEVRLMNGPNDLIRQTFVYSVEHQPLKSVLFSVPEALKESDSFVLTVDGKTVLPQNIQSEPIEGADDGRTRKQVTFSEGGRIGRCTVTLEYPCVHSELLPRMTNRLALELVQPEDGTLIENRLTVKTTPGVLIETLPTAEEGWTKVESAAASSGSAKEYRFTAEEKTARISLRATVTAEDALGTTVFDRVWIQTWLAAGNRYERLACRLVSDRESFDLRLPSPTRGARVRILLDGKPYVGDEEESVGAESQKIIRIYLAESQRGRPVLLDVSYFIAPDASGTTGDIELPRFEGPSVWVRRCYWQVILPETRHIIGGVNGWTPEYYDTTWSGFFFKRVASMGQEELGTWVGVQPSEQIPDRTNVYLFSSFSLPEKSQLWLVNRATLILFGSGAMLLFGLSFLYFPVTRYQGVLLFLILLSVAVFVYRPVVILIFLQTTVLGVLMTFLAMLLRRWVRRRTVAVVSDRSASGVQPMVADGERDSDSSFWVDENNQREENGKGPR